MRSLLEKAGIPVLHNRAVPLDRGPGRVVLAGIDDSNAGRPDLPAALGEARSLQPGPETPVLLLSHNPDVFFDAARSGVCLTLAGHTHGGQIRAPGLPVLVRMSRYHLDHGRYVYGDAELVVSRGIGVSGVPLRLACSPEVVLVRLHPGQE
jgi:predicted MPP superfamily phosphohydrolase